MSTAPRKSRLAAAVIALAIACGVAIGLRVPGTQRGSGLEWLETPRPVASFSLASGSGEFTAAALLGQWQMLLLGFTACTDLCPTTLSELAALNAALGDTPLRIVLVSIDPQRDSPRRLAEFTAYFSDNAVGVTGADTQLQRLAHSLGMDYRRYGDATAPIISHSPTVALIGPDARLHGRLRPGFQTAYTAAELARRIRNRP